MSRRCKVAICAEVAFFLALLCYLALNLTVRDCPDEWTRLQIPFWILDNGTLPTGTEPLLRIHYYGFSYATSCYGPSILAAMFMKVASLFNCGTAGLVVAARVPSVLSGIGLVLACNGIGYRLFRKRAYGLCLAALVAGLPQVVFLCSYHNNDAPSLFGAAFIVYAWLYGRDSGWSVRSCVLLGAAIGITALTYYFAFGFILLSIPVYFVCQVGRVRRGACSGRDMWLGALMILAVAGLIGGWFYARMAICLGGDVFGTRTTRDMRQTFASPSFRLGGGYTMQEKGVSFIDMLFVRQEQRLYAWWDLTLKSLVGTFGNMSVPLSFRMYFAYGLLIIPMIAGAVSLAKNKTSRMICLATVIAAFLAVAVSAYYSYTSDYQPQGRYVITLAIPLGVLVLAGLCAIDRWVEGTLAKRDKPTLMRAVGLVPPVSFVCTTLYVMLLVVIVLTVIAPTSFNGILTGYRYWWPYWY